MNIDSDKLSPAELLAQLKAEASASKTETPAAKDDGNVAVAESASPSTNPPAATNKPAAAAPQAGPVAGNPRLADLFNRVNDLLGKSPTEPGEVFKPTIPETLDETRLTFEEVERLILKYLFAKGSAHGRQICMQISLPFSIVDPILKQLNREQRIALKGAAAMGDYEFAITDSGRERARNYTRECTYFGAAPVSLHDYVKSVRAQSIADQLATEE